MNTKTNVPTWDDLISLFLQYAEENSGTLSQRQSYVAAANLLEVYYGIDAISAFKIDLNALDDTPPVRRVAPKPVEAAPEVAEVAEVEPKKTTRTIPVRPPTRFGRPPTVRGMNFPIYLDQASVDIAAELGNGNLSAGVRLALNLAASAKRGEE